jgi:CheY-like chemotaxis protein
MEIKKVMVIDDNPDIVEMARIFLMTSGYEVITAYSGPEALMKIQSELPDLIFLDIMMREMNGKEVLDLLKVDDQTKNIPVVMLTALDDPEVRLDSAKGGADHFLAKPFTQSDMINVINETQEKIEGKH